MISPKHAGLLMIAVAMILIALSAAAKPVLEIDMKPGAVCTTQEQIDADMNLAFARGRNVGHQIGGQAAVNELLGHFNSMCSMYQNSPDKAGLSAPTVELRNGIRIQCAK